MTGHIPCSAHFQGSWTWQVTDSFSHSVWASPSAASLRHSLAGCHEPTGAELSAYILSVTFPLARERYVIKPRVCIQGTVTVHVPSLCLSLTHHALSFLDQKSHQGDVSSESSLRPSPSQTHKHSQELALCNWNDSAVSTLAPAVSHPPTPNHVFQ